MTKAMQAVVFDLGNVLIDVVWERGVERAAPLTPLAPEAIIPTLAQHPALRDYEEGRIDDDAFCAAAVAALELDMPQEDFAAVWADLFARRPGMEAFFEEVRRRVPVAILSDTSPIHWRHIRTFAPLFAQADALVLSYETGVHKPDPLAYRTAADRLGVAPEACVFVDDLQPNVEGARAAGMQALRFTTEDEVRERILGLLPEAADASGGR